MSRDDILTDIFTALERTNELRPPNEHIPCAEDTILFGPAGVLDSMGLVALLMDVEEAVNARAGTSISLSDEHAMSQRRNPFRTVGSLADYILGRLHG